MRVLGTSAVIIGLVLFLAGTGSALAYTPKSTLRVFSSYAVPTATNDLIGLTVEADSTLGLGVVFEIRQEHYFGVEIGALLYEFDFEITDVNVVFARAAVVPLTIGVDFHLLRRHVEPDIYITPLVSYNFWGDLESVDTDERITLDNEWGYGAVLGMDIPVGDRGWQFNLALRYLRMSASVGQVGFKVDPIFAEFGFGYRF